MEGFAKSKEPGDAETTYRSGRADRVSGETRADPEKLGAMSRRNAVEVDPTKSTV